MKRLSLIVVGVTCSLLQSAYGQLIYEPFPTSYTNTGTTLSTVNAITDVGQTLNLGGAPTWAGGASGGGAPIVTAGAALTYSGLAAGQGLGVFVPSTASGNRTTGVAFTPTSSGTLYASFLLDVLQGSTGNRQLAFLASATSLSASAGVNGIFLNSSSQLQIAKNSSTTPGAGNTAALSLNTTYLVVVGYTFNGVGNEFDLWLNPGSLGGSAPTPDISMTAGTDFASLNSFFLQQRNNASSLSASFIFDELRVGTSWADVTPAVPEPATFALAGLGMLGLVLARRVRR